MAFATVDIAMLLHMRVERHIAGGFGELVARHVVARLVEAELLCGEFAAAAYQVLRALIEGVVAGYPVHAFDDLLFDLWLVARQAILAGFHVRIG